MVCWHVAQSMAATCHLLIGLKALQPVGLDPATSQAGEETWEGPPTGVPPYEPYYIYEL
jgi:hypothetical protein